MQLVKDSVLQANTIYIHNNIINKYKLFGNTLQYGYMKYHEFMYKLIHAFIHALLSRESSGTNTSSIFFIHDFMNEQHLN